VRVPDAQRYAINILENRLSEILLLKRSPEAMLGANAWGFVGGHIEAGETPLHCSLREMREELGCEPKLTLLGQVGPVRDSFYGGKFEIHLFHYRWHEGKIVLNPEHCCYAWVSREDYHKYPVMDGIDEDLAYFNLWPQSYLNQDKLPKPRVSDCHISR
jgi:ADP-ribose pyrophosphatase